MRVLTLQEKEAKKKGGRKVNRSHQPDNGLIHRYLPNKTSLTEVMQQDHQ